jgi:hypothetical protein
MATIYLRDANITAQWYQDNYSGTTFPRVDKFLIHTTETGGWPGYSAGASAPNATYYPKFRQIRQHFGINRSARALRDPSSTAVRENRDNVFQLEIICYSDYRLAVERGGLWVGDLTDSHMRDIAAMILQIHRDWNLPIQSSVTWREGRQTWYDNVRLTGPQFDAYRGILGHVHASGNTHWDPGGFRYSKLVKALDWQLVNHPVYGGGVNIPPPPTLEDWFDMATQADLENALRKVLKEQQTISGLAADTLPDAWNTSPLYLSAYGAMAASPTGRTRQAADVWESYTIGSGPQQGDAPITALAEAATFSLDARNRAGEILANQAKALAELASIRAALDGTAVDTQLLAAQVASLLLPGVQETLRTSLADVDGVDEDAVAAQVVAKIGNRLAADAPA